MLVFSLLRCFYPLVLPPLLRITVVIHLLNGISDLGTTDRLYPLEMKVDNTSAWVDVQNIGPDTSHAVTASW